jgi:hypothetical protein
MQTLKYLAVFLCFLLSEVLLSQSKDSVLSDLMFYGDVMVNASRADSRSRAESAFYEGFRRYLADHPNWTEQSAQLPWVTVVTPPDSAFRVVTWQVEGEDTYLYRGFVQFRGNQQPIVELRDTRPLNSEYASYGPAQWYGAIYYGIEPFKTSTGNVAYVLLGFNAYNRQLNQRVADVLLVEEENLTFGSPVFWVDSTRTELRSRVLIEYADAAAGTMRFDREKRMIIYDNVIPVDTPEGPTLVPDGSYFGYQYANGQWELVNKVFTLKLDAPPGGRPKEEIQRDIFGNPRSKREK